jgi:hypothetical protein
LIKLAQIDSLPTKRICANALFNLTCDTDSQAVLMKIGVGRVMKDLANFRQADDMKVLVQWHDLEAQKHASGHASLSAVDKEELAFCTKLRRWRSLDTVQRAEFEDKGLLIPKAELSEKEGLKAELVDAKRCAGGPPRSDLHLP